MTRERAKGIANFQQLLLAMHNCSAKSLASIYVLLFAFDVPFPFVILIPFLLFFWSFSSKDTSFEDKRATYVLLLFFGLIFMFLPEIYDGISAPLAMCNAPSTEFFILKVVEEKIDIKENRVVHKLRILFQLFKLFLS